MLYISTILQYSDFVVSKQFTLYNYSYLCMRGCTKMCYEHSVQFKRIVVHADIRLRVGIRVFTLDNILTISLQIVVCFPYLFIVNGKGLDK